VLFIDMDYFFAACEELRHPELKSKPLVVGTATIAKKERGVVQTCNYEARKYGIRSAMATAQALKLKPDLVYLESDDEYYAKTSDSVMGLLKGYGFDMEVLSIDEAALDIGDMDYHEALELAKGIKSRINAEMGLPCTIGISIGKIFAKMMCDDSKPNGIGLLKKEDLKDYLKEKRVEDILGVGKKTAERLASIGIERIGDIPKKDPNLLVEKIGSFGKELYLLANGIDTSKVVQSTGVLSIGRERTLEFETRDLAVINGMLDELSKEVVKELEKQGLWFKGISVKARYSDFSERIKNRKLSNYTDSVEFLGNTAKQLIRELVTDKNIRKVGVRTYILEKMRGQRKIF
jgi:nucleotidyltransferase/DNA polymerase involved in DNA repair